MSPISGLARALLGGSLLVALACQSSSPSASDEPEAPPAAPAAPAARFLDRAKQVAVGHMHSCALVEGGAVYCWGEGSQGGLGQGSWDDSRVPVRVHGVDDAKEIVSGAMFSCALLGSGRVMCWGGGLLDGTSDGSTRARTQPALVPDLADAVELAANDFSACARKRDGTVACWGGNLARRPHGPGPDGHHLPHLMAGLAGVHQIAAGGLHLCAIQGADRALVCVGLDHDIGQPDRYEDPVLVTPSGWTGVDEVQTGRHTCFRRGGSRSWQCWGGDVKAPAAAALRGSEPIQTLQFRGEGGCRIDRGGALSCWKQVGLGPGARVERIGPVRSVSAASMDHACAVDDQGAAYCWGDNQWGALGDGTATARPVPVRVLAPASTAAVALQPAPAPQGTPFTADEIAAGYDETCARSGTEIWCWGERHGVRHDDPRRYHRRPEKLTGLPARPVEIAAGFGFMCARLTTGQVWCWGANDRGQLGDGTRETRFDPVAVKGISDAVGLSVGYGQSCVLRPGNQVACWSDERGASDLALLARWRGQIAEVALGGHICVRLRSGQVLCQGDNSKGQIGNGEGGCWPDPADVRCSGTRMPCKRREICAKSDTFVPVAGVKDATALALGDFSTCAVHSGGKVSCWGDGSQGRLGVGDRVATITRTATQIPGLTGVQSLTAYGSHTCALRTDGQALCWGQNVWGELGERTKENRFSPTPVHTLNDAVELSAGMSHTCARRRDRTVWCWGENDGGTLGVGIADDISRLSQPYAVRN